MASFIASSIFSFGEVSINEAIISESVLVSNFAPLFNCSIFNDSAFIIFPLCAIAKLWFLKDLKIG